MNTTKGAIEIILDDAWNIGRVSIANALTSIEEAWTPERADEIIKHAAAKGNRHVEHVTIGEYDLNLWDTPISGGRVYMVSLNGGQSNPNSLEDQTDDSQKGFGQIPWQTISRHVSRWVDQYGSVVVGSAVEKKTKMYLKWLRRLGYNMVPFLGDYRYGAVISKQRTKELAEQIVEHLLSQQ
jgi:hypothetical protein